MPCWVHHVHLSLRSGFASWDRCIRGILCPSKNHLFAAFQLSSPALLQAGAHPELVQSSNHKAKVWESCRLGVWRHFELSCSRDVRAALRLAAWPGRAAGANCSFHPSALSHRREIRSDSYCSFPSLLTRAWQGDGACCYSQACHLLTQQLWWENSVGGMLDPASLTFH